MEENNYLEEIVQSFIEKIKHDNEFREEYLHTFEKSFLDKEIVIKIPLKVEKERKKNFYSSSLKEHKELNQIYNLDYHVLKAFLEEKNNAGYRKVHLELIRLNKIEGLQIENFNFERLLFAFYTDVNPNQKFMLMDVNKPILISDPESGEVKNNIFYKSLKSILDQYVIDNDLEKTKRENTQIITLCKDLDVKPVMSLPFKSTDNYTIQFTPAIIKDSYSERVHYRKAEYNHQYTLIMKGIVNSKLSKSIIHSDPFDTFCLNPPDPC
ncbi:hypothetical protein FIA58_002565 [Flavobacterium jejuense]|uniref:Uncharacterized protein n=1 Tax=Flavobacterium jejuense TaxID=1544455 RepID=A0ABX0IL58_9FLAO|nr:hypothetical protein [Flavobacterium jejuense]NHN24547.1 hypothetical protein [Flavobacterium jejuense]